MSITIVLKLQLYPLIFIRRFKTDLLNFHFASYLKKKKISETQLLN